MLTPTKLATSFSRRQAKPRQHLILPNSCNGARESAPASWSQLKLKAGRLTMNPIQENSGNSRHQLFAYLMGLITAAILIALAIGYAGLRVGFTSLAAPWKQLYSSWEDVLDMPDPILQELTSLSAVVDNVGNPTRQRDHYTILVEGD